jgi:undecaprenyl-diphosphatase
MDFIAQLDRQLFLIINGCHTPILDFIMFWLSDKYIWIPLYAILLILLIKENRRQWWLLLIAVVLLVVLTDQISVKLFKDVFQRLRPCHDPLLDGMARVLNDHCGGAYGFVSSHAANTFGLAVFVGFLLKNRFKWILWALLLWAAMISYSRVYLGVHFPGDVLAGGMVGALIGYGVYRVFLLGRNRMG